MVLLFSSRYFILAFLALITAARAYFAGHDEAYLREMVGSFDGLGKKLQLYDLETDDTDFVQKHESLRFLWHFMPKGDRHRFSNDTAFNALVKKNVYIAERVRDPSIPTGIFVNEILPYFVLTEKREPWRAMFWNILSYCCSEVRTASPSKSGNDLDSCLYGINISSIEDITEWANYENKIISAGAGKEAPEIDLPACLPYDPLSDTKSLALWAAKAVWKLTSPPIKFKSAKPNELNYYSVFDVILAKESSCTGLALVLTAFLRTIGVPARIAGVPHWNRGRKLCPKGDADDNCGNHNWVEFYDLASKKWHFIDQTAIGVDDIRTDHGWFYPSFTKNQVLGSLNHSIYSSSFAPPRVMAAMFHREYAPTDHSEFPKTSRMHFPLVWDWKNLNVFAWDITLRYVDHD